MTHEIDMNDEFARGLLEAATDQPTREPRAYYNSDGDCIEFLWSDESYYAERIDPILTVYYGRESKQIVGSLIKRVKPFLQETTRTSPGFMIEVEDGRIRLQHLLTAGMWRSGQPLIVKTYKKLRDTAQASNIEVEIPQLA